MDGVAAVRDHAAPRDTCQEAFMVTEFNQGNGSVALDQFTRRNTGRTVTVEVDSKEFGAQHESVNAPLRGVASDRQEGRIAIMLGPLDGSEGHLTHMIDAPTEVAIVTRDDGKDGVLRVANQDSSTFLMLEG